MNNSRLNYLPFLISFLPVLCSAATLNVDKGDPSCNDTTGTPYCTISAGVSHASAGDTVAVGVGTYSENLTIAKDITLLGAGAGSTFIDGGGSNRTVFTQGIVTISNVTIQNGDASESGLGGGIWVNMGSLTLTDSVVTGNRAGDGGGIGTAATLIMVRSLITNNIASNTMGTSSGGGLYIGSGGGTDIRDSTISNNVSAYSGGGIFNMGYSTTVTNSTVSGNTVTGGEGGGGIANGSGSSASITLSSVTITDNTANVRYGGIYNTNGVVHLRNSILAGNTDPGISPDCGGESIASDGYNFIGTTAGCNISVATGDIRNSGADVARLGPLASNGGLATTHAIRSGSVLIDAGDPSGCADAGATVLTGDETGGARAVDGDADGFAACDIGAFELKHGVVVDSGISALVTTESGGTASIEVVLVSQPTADVTLSLASSDITEGTVSPNTVTFTALNWNIRQQVVISGIDDNDIDGDVSYTVSIGETASMDPNYNAIALGTVDVTNTDDDAATGTTSGSGGGGGGSFDILLLSMLLTGVGAHWRRRLQ